MAWYFFFGYLIDLLNNKHKGNLNFAKKSSRKNEKAKRDQLVSASFSNSTYIYIYIYKCRESRGGGGGGGCCCLSTMSYFVCEREK